MSTARSGPSDNVAVAIIGDGPAGSGLAQACRRAGVEAVLIGDDEPWNNTYGTWVDDLDAVDLLDEGAAGVLATEHSDIAVWSDRRHQLERAYGLIDNAKLRAVLREGVHHHRDRVALVRTGSGSAHSIEFEGGSGLSARLVIDCTGWPATFATKSTGQQEATWQTAFGVVLPEPPDGDLGTPTLMDFRPVGGPSSSASAGSSTTFAYSLPVSDGWLVEETVLAARPAIEPIALVDVLAARLGRSADDLLNAAIRTEYVRIPMAGPRARRGQPIVAFGAAGSFVNPISGYSVVASLAAASRVAHAISDSISVRDSMSVRRAGRPGEAVDALPIWNAVWPRSERRTRVLHDYGLDMLMRLDGDALRSFFGAFFDLPTDRWSAYLRSSTPPAEVSAVMADLFRAAPWSTRRRLVAGNPMAFARLVRPT